jgi:hypothetical protein
MPPATIAAAAAFLATCLSFEGILEDDFFFVFDDLLGFLELIVFDLGPARREEEPSLARLAVFFMTAPMTFVAPVTRVHHLTVQKQD